MNKKGVFWAVPVLIVVAVLIGAIMLFSGDSILGVFLGFNLNIFAVAGLALIALTIMYAVPSALRGDFSNRKVAFLLMLLLVGGFIIALPNTGLIEMAGIGIPGGYIESPIFSYIKCEQCGSIDTTPVYTKDAGNKILNRPPITDAYEVTVFVPESVIGARKLLWAVCDEDNEADCLDKIENSPNEVNLNLLSSNYYVIPRQIDYKEKVIMSYQKRNIYLRYTDYPITYQLQFQRYCLREYSIKSGPLGAINTVDCKINFDKGEYISTDIKSILKDVEQISTDRVSQFSFQPNERRYYVDGFVTSPAPSLLLDYNNQDAWCRQDGTTAKIYKVNEVKVGAFTYKIASPDLSDLLDVKVGGCCPGHPLGDSVCGDDFTYKQITGSECGGFKTCGYPNPLPFGEKQTIEYQCVENKCQPIIKNVSCSSDYDCGDNQRCNLNTFTCEDIEIEEGGDPKPKAEKTDVCTAFWETPYVYSKETKDYGTWGYKKWLGLQPNTETETGVRCRTAGWVWIVGFGLVAVILLFVLLKPKKNPIPQKVIRRA
jgi:hypothetical protein